MNISLDAENQLLLQGRGITLRGIQFVLNGAALDAPLEPMRRDANTVHLRAAVAPGAEQCGISCTRESDGSVTLRYWLEGLPAAFAPDSFGIRFMGVRGARAFLRSGYFSWDGSEYIAADEARTSKGYALTQLVAETNGAHVLLGLERHDRFQHTMTWQGGAEPCLTVETLWDRIPATDGRCESETLLVLEHTDAEEGLREWARRVAARAPLPPRRVPRITGWCSWYNLYASITEENILEQLRGVVETAERAGLPMRVFQIDDGFTPEMGDWLEVKPQFPRGMKPLLAAIRAAGMVPGLWIAPFMVGNRSRLFREHPDWVVRARATGEPLTQMQFYGEFRWHKRSEEYYILDTTHPQAFAYLREVFRVWRREWGCDYFKTDFMQFGSEHGADDAVYHTPGMTRIEIWRRTAEMIRAEIGDALWLGCGCPLWASVGLVDAVRIGRDVGVAWDGARPAAELVRDVANRSFGNGILWQTDPDCILLRDRFHFLSDTEIRASALFGGLLGGVLMTSDALAELSPERLRLWKFLLDTPIRECRMPLLAQSLPVLVLVIHSADWDGVFVWNLGATEVVFETAWSALGLQVPETVVDWMAREIPLEAAQLTCALAPHESKLVLVTPPLPSDKHG